MNTSITMMNHDDEDSVSEVSLWSSMFPTRSTHSANRSRVSFGVVSFMGQEHEDVPVEVQADEPEPNEMEYSR